MFSYYTKTKCKTPTQLQQLTQYLFVLELESQTQNYK